MTGTHLSRCNLKGVARLALAIAVLLVTVALAPPAEAAKFYPLDYEARNDPSAFFFEPVCNAKLHDVIRPGDYERIKSKLESFALDSKVAAPRTEEGVFDFRPRDGAKGIFALCLSSRGGDVNEALKLSELFADWTMVVAKGEECSSACAILFMMARRRDDVFWYGSDDPGRFLHYSARLGFHAPRIQLPGDSNGKVSVDDAVQAYARAIETIRSVSFHKQDLEAGGGRFSFAGSGETGVRIPLDLIVAFVTVPPKSMFEVTTIDEAHRWGIEIYGIAPPRALTEDLLKVACRSVALVRCNSKVPYDESNCHHWGEAWTPVALEGGIGARWHKDNARRTKWIESFADRTVARKRVLWPKPGGGQRTLAVQRFELRAASSGSEFPANACAMTATWHRDRMQNLEIVTFNGIGGEQPWSPAADFTGQSADERLDSFARGEALRGNDHLRPWKMLPVEARLKDLGDDPWGWLDDGPDFFDKPARW